MQPPYLHLGASRNPTTLLSGHCCAGIAASASIISTQLGSILLGRRVAVVAANQGCKSRPAEHQPRTAVRVSPSVAAGIDARQCDYCRCCRRGQQVGDPADSGKLLNRQSRAPGFAARRRNAGRRQADLWMDGVDDKTTHKFSTVSTASARFSTSGVALSSSREFSGGVSTTIYLRRIRALGCGRQSGLHALLKSVRRQAARTRHV